MGGNVHVDPSTIFSVRRRRHGCSNNTICSLHLPSGRDLAAWPDDVQLNARLITAMGCFMLYLHARHAAGELASFERHVTAINQDVALVPVHIHLARDHWFIIFIPMAYIYIEPWA